MQEKPLITIGMAFCNEAHVLEISIRSLLSQSYTNWELLLMDDGSNDRSLDIARSFSDPRINIFSDGEHRTLPFRLNQCIKLATGEYFARMDADDIAYPDRLSAELQFLQAHSDVDLVATYVSTIDDHGKMFGKMQGPTDHKHIVKRALLGFRMIHPTWMGRLSWFRRYMYSEEATYAQDQELLYRAYRHSRYAVIPKILLAYRQDPLSIRKLMRARIVWMQHIKKQLHGPKGLPKKVVVAGILSLKAAVDLVAVSTGLGYSVLRHRALPVTTREIREYNSTMNEILRTYITHTGHSHLKGVGIANTPLNEWWFQA
jgi:glycosyltransferase involved in cell wall biosynthesis